MERKIGLNRIVIAGITPYFLKRGNFWFEKIKKRPQRTLLGINIKYLRIVNSVPSV